MFNDDDIRKENRARCAGCEYRHLVHANGGYSFYGCYCRPYKGKRIVEIEVCPKKGKVE